MNFVLKSYQGQEALDIANHERLIVDWEKLINKQDKLCVFQNRTFVSTWYRCYFESYSPLLILARDKDDQLIGLLPLAVHREKNYVVCAGDELAEYHGFIAEPSYEEEFGIQCLRELKRNFSFGHWRLGWLAPDSNTSWINKDVLAKHGIYFHLEEVPDPVWNLLDPTKLRKIKKRGNVKRSYRQYRQRGDFRYERILGSDRMTDLLEEFSKQMDFKKEALFNRRLFETDPHIKDFLTALQEFPEMNHFSVLFLDDKPIAFNHGYIDNGEICLAGYTSYNPSESRHSPGKLHLVELAEASTEEGIERIDLTPGKDAYKTRFSNDSRQVQKVTFYLTGTAKIWGNAKQTLKRNGFNLFSKFGLKDNDVKYYITDLRAYGKRLKKSGIPGILDVFQSFVQRKHTYRVYKVSNTEGLYGEEGMSDVYDVKKNDYADLINYQEPKNYVSRKTLFEKSLTRFSRGDKLYSLSHKGKLIYLAWLRDGKYELKLPGTKYHHQFPENTRVIYGFSGFGDPVEQENLDAFYDEIIKDCKEEGISDVYLCFCNQEKASDKYMQKRKLEKVFTHSHRQSLYFIHKARHQEEEAPKEAAVPV